MATLHELAYWNSRTYGQALRIPKNVARSALIAACVVTPFTNWLIPFTRKLIKEDFLIRY